MYRWIALCGGLLGACAVAGGALGAHFLKGELSAELFETYETALNYLLPHAVLLVCIGCYGARVTRSPWLRVAAAALTLGTVLFAGGLIGWVLTLVPSWRGLAPIGGSLLIAGWVLLAFALFRAAETPAREPNLSGEFK